MRWSRLAMRRALGPARVLWVDPRRVMFHVGTNAPAIEAQIERLAELERRHPPIGPVLRVASRALYQADAWRIVPSRYPVPQPITEDSRYQLVADLIAHRDRLPATLWFQESMEQLSRHGHARHKAIVLRSRDEILDFLRSYVLGMIDSLARDGYDSARGGKPGSALIGPGGTLHKAHSGNHRFFAARILGVAPVPLLVAGAHGDWVDEVAGARPDVARLREALMQTAARFA
jgi:hypothetical protein